MGTLIGAAGAILLALLAPLSSLPFAWMGVVLALGGASLTFGILWTGARGRRKARAPLALFISIPVACLAATALVVVKVAGQAAIEQVDPFLADGEGDLDPFDERLPVPDPRPAPEPPPAGVASAAPRPVPPARPKPAPPAPEPVAATPKPRPVSSKPAPPPAVKPEPLPPLAPVRTTDAPRPRPLAKKPLASREPLPARDPGPERRTVEGEVVHFMLNDNLQAKRCFLPLLEANLLPDQVDTRFAIRPDGRAENFEITAPDVHRRGSELERCLDRVITTLQFPASQVGASVEYPFILK